MNEQLIQGKVARILNSRELAINIGSNNGVQVGMYFDVLDPKGENITDPDTGEILGSVMRPKVKVKVTKVLERLSITSTYKKKVVNIGGGGFGIASFAEALMPARYVNRFESLKTTEKTWEDLDEAESFVKTGDPVIQVETEEEEEK